MDEIKFLANAISYDSVTNEFKIKIDFIDPDKQEILEQLCLNKNLFTFSFKKPFRRMKTYPQLKKYYKMITMILFKFLQYKPKAIEVKALDEDIKKSCLSCKTMSILGSDIPVVPSKADMTVEELGFLIQTVEERYENILNEEN